MVVTFLLLFLDIYSTDFGAWYVKKTEISSSFSKSPLCGLFGARIVWYQSVCKVKKWLWFRAFYDPKSHASRWFQEVHWFESWETEECMDEGSKGNRAQLSFEHRHFQCPAWTPKIPLSLVQLFHGISSGFTRSWVQRKDCTMRSL